MKIENNYLNEAKFRAIYIGQNVLSHPKNDEPYMLSSDMVFGERDRFLSLRSIESLTDDELIFISKLLGHKVFVGDRYMRNIMNGAWLNQPLNVVIQIIDYLRYISVLIPFMGLSMDDILEYGWAVIREAKG